MNNMKNLMEKLINLFLFKLYFCAGFYNELVKRPDIKVGLYDHGVLSKYLDMGGNMTLYKSSYDW